jgi:hypothetical protein
VANPKVTTRASATSIPIPVMRHIDIADIAKPFPAAAGPLWPGAEIDGNGTDGNFPHFRTNLRIADNDILRGTRCRCNRRPARHLSAMLVQTVAGAYDGDGNGAPSPFFRLTKAAPNIGTKRRGHPELVEGPLRAGLLNGVAVVSRLTKVLRQAQDDGTLGGTMRSILGLQRPHPLRIR